MSNESFDVDMSLADHIDELRRRIIRVVGTFVVFSILGFLLKDDLVDVAFAPSQPDFLFNRWMVYLSDRFGVAHLAINQIDTTYVNTSMAGQFNLHISISLFFGFVVSLPFMLWQLWAFVRPALESRVQRQCRWLFLQVAALFFVGLGFGYLFVSPLAINFLVNYSVSDRIVNLIAFPSYLATVMNVSLAAALIFQLPHFVYVLARVGLLTSGAMKRYRRYAIVLIFIISAIITPPDVFSQILIALPFYALYEYGIGVAKREEKRRDDALKL